jgi:dienelactone hydrolase
MAHIALFHSVYGLRPAVLTAAERLRDAGHHVVATDLYAGTVAATIDEGFKVSEQIGWETIMRRARHVVRELTHDAVLAGFSMGAGIVGDLLRDRRSAAGLLLFHGIGAEPAAVRAGLGVHLHIADPDEFFPPATVTAWSDAMTRAGASVHVHAYPGAGHLFTDPDTTDYDESATNLAWRRSLTFLASM